MSRGQLTGSGTIALFHALRAGELDWGIMSDAAALVRHVSHELGPVTLGRSISAGLTHSIDLAQRQGRPGLIRQLSAGLVCPKSE